MGRREPLKSYEGESIAEVHQGSKEDKEKRGEGLSVNLRNAHARRRR